MTIYCCLIAAFLVGGLVAVGALTPCCWPFACLPLLCSTHCSSTLCIYVKLLLWLFGGCVLYVVPSLVLTTTGCSFCVCVCLVLCCTRTTRQAHLLHYSTWLSLP